MHVTGTFDGVASGSGPITEWAVMANDLATVSGDSRDFVGFADAPSDLALTGWALCRGAPRIPVALTIMIDDQAVGTLVCDQPCDNLRALGLPAGMGGFRFEFPAQYRDNRPRRLALRCADGSFLAMKDAEGRVAESVNFVLRPLTAIEGVVDGLQNGMIRGWAVRRDHATGAVQGRLRIRVLCNHVDVGEIVADRGRIDVARELRCDPDVGFEFSLPPHCRSGEEFLFSFLALPEGQELANSPLPLLVRDGMETGEIASLSRMVEELCAAVFRLDRKVRDLIPVANATLHDYDEWGRRHQASLRARMAQEPPLPAAAPLVSIIMPTYRTELSDLAAALESVRGQSYANWQLIVSDDGSNSPALRACLESYAAADPRIVCVFNRRRGGISAATNAALAVAQGAYIMLFDHDDVLSAVAVETMVRAALRSGARVIYSDEDKIDRFGTLSEPHFKPDWNYRLLLGVNYVCHLLMIDAALLRRVGPLRSIHDGAQDHDLVLRLSEACAAEDILHVPQVLYHWRRSPTSTSQSNTVKPHAIEAGRRAVADHLARRGFAASVVRPVDDATTYSVRWGFVEEPDVTVIIPFRDQVAITTRCLDALLANTAWRDWRVILVDNGSVTAEAAEFCRQAAAHERVVVRRVDEAFNFSRLNNIAAAEYPAEYYVFLNNDVILLQPDWLRVMMDEALADPKVAIVGAKLLYPNATVQHAGVVLGVGGVADHAFRGIGANDPGYVSRARCAQQYSAVTAACMLCRADMFMAVGGFDEHELGIAFNDVDLCLKAAQAGWRIVWTPEMVAEHHESLSRGDDMAPAKVARFFRENYLMNLRWHAVLPADPFYNPNFSRIRGVFRDLR